MRLDLVDQPLRFEALDDPLARDEAIEPVKLQCLVELRRRHNVGQKGVVVLEIQAGPRRPARDQRQLVAPPDLEIVEIMGRRDLHRAGALLGIGIVVADDRNAPADQRQERGLADEMPQPLVLRMDRDRGVAQHRLRPGRCHHDGFAGPSTGYLMLPQWPLTSTCSTSRSKPASGISGPN